MKKLVLFYFCFCTAFLSFASDKNGKKLTKPEYIAMYKQNAIRSMHEFKIPASITMAQAILESGTGNSELAQKSNNHFGIKCHKEWEGKKVYHDDDAKNECFRFYDDVYESFEDHSRFLTTRERYAFLFEIDIDDYKKWAYGLKKAGYATNPQYAQMLIKIIEENNLQELDTEALTGVRVKASNGKVTDDEVRQGYTKPVSSIDQLPSKNRVKYVIAEETDTYLSIAQEYEMMLWQLHKYNDVERNAEVSPGAIVYLKPKKSSAAVDYHIVKEGDNLYSISQLYAVKLKKLYKYNSLRPGDKLSGGQKIKLRR